ncbi:FMN-dependent NADH-azoreductase [Mycoplasmopsis ciconiae]|uniref:FMN-dependent NADH-azoreductase n=1 Tax=Mycoplasmopsis ciconiae TaxID=561067 RepID=A0ABU7MKU0_9BACT|nr:FMN-dependent NADH-azoreductase [Mycoplasmopsis ciconiae]
MEKVLFLHGNVMADDKSISNQLEKRFLELYALKHPSAEIEVIDLDQTKLAEVFLTKETLKDMKYYKEVDSDFWIEKLKQVNSVVISCPMINFGPSAIVKNFIDAICVANKTFSYKYSKKGDAIGLLDHLKVMILTTQGAPADWYPWGSHVKWLEGTWKFLGAQKVESILIGGTKLADVSSLSASEIVKLHDAEIEDKVAKF